MSRWAHWSTGTEEKGKSFGSVKEAMGNPSAALGPAERARQLGLQSNGKGGYIDPASGQVVARTVNNELIFYDNNSATGGAISDGSDGAALTQAQPSWADPLTGMLTTPPSKAETPSEIAAIPDATPATAPFGYNSFMKKKKMAAYQQNAVEPQMSRGTPDEIEQENQQAQQGDPGEQSAFAAEDVVREGEETTPEGMLDRLSQGQKPSFSHLIDKARKLSASQRMAAAYDRRVDDVLQSKNTQTPAQPEPNPQEPGQPSLDDLIAGIRGGLDNLQDIGGKMSASGDELGDQLVDATDSGNVRDAIRTIGMINSRSQDSVGDEDDIYNVTSSGGLGSDRGRYVEQGLTDHVLPEIFGDKSLQFHNDGGPRVKTDVRSTRNGEDVNRYTVKSTVGTDGLEANNAGFRRFFNMWGLDPQSGPGMMISRLMGIPLDFAEEQGFGDNLGLWDDRRDGLHRDGLSAIRKMPLQLLYPGMKFGTEELNANSMLPETLKKLHPQEFKEGMEWLMDTRPEIVRRIMSQRDNDFGPDGSADPEARPNVDFDPNPVDRAAWYHLDKASRGSPVLKGNLDIHDVSPEQVKKVIQDSQWNLSDSISGGLSLDVPFEGRGGSRSLMTLSRKANKAGGGRYGNGFHSPRFGYKHNSFDPFPHVSSTPVEMTMGAKQSVPELRGDGTPKVDRQGQPKTKVVDGKIIPGSVKIGKTTWGEGYEPGS